ncbi:hypothetical protein EC912_102754 [Luteibacter rhizovicinus]|uniref:Uncharacterized protein n=1 Tax=Luteibacter rhizovicinus TaxID=242606 RepID=A0A4R3YYG5_9GAMM|nr:hypothetical protein EC912_102754 [Luteibacter rhizovicinus]
MRGFASLLICVAFAFASVAAASKAVDITPNCKIVDARYVAVVDGKTEIRFVRHGYHWISDLSMQLLLANGRSYWFLFDWGSGSETNLISTGDQTAKDFKPPDGDGGVRPLPGMQFYALTKDLEVLSQGPQSANRAPAYLFVPGLTDALRYAAEPRIVLPLTMFRLSSCGVWNPERTSRK